MDNGYSTRHSRLVLTNISLYYTVHVSVKTKPGMQQAFKEASLKNAHNSAMEPGVASFDVLQDKQDDTQFVLVNVYKNQTAPSAHLKTPHCVEWTKTTANMMAEPEQARIFDNILRPDGKGPPAKGRKWDHSDNFKFL
jgi:autoinducer 2-degrading protein